MSSRLGLVFLLLLVSKLVTGQGGVSLNDNWQFQKGEDTVSTGWHEVGIPHTWNAEDAFEDNGYYRGIGWYKKNLEYEKNWWGKQVYLEFEGVNQVAAVYLNGQLVGRHIGGYNGFVFNISNHLDSNSENLLLIKVDNSHNDDIIPLKGDFNFYGGIYRDIYLFVEDPIHFDRELGASGVFIKSEVNDKDAKLTLDLVLNNTTAESSKLVATASVIAEGVEVSAQKKRISVSPGQSTYTLGLPLIINPRLWSPEDPYLYRVRVEIAEKNGMVLDTYEQPYGLRYFEFTADRGFFLNGKHLKLTGTNRHQDYAGKGNALSNDIHLSDIKMLKEMGGNFLRTAHYPQDPAVLQACDQLGILVSMEIPLDHTIHDSEAFYQNSKIAMKEMIRQHFNHPSIIIWAYMNEMLLGRSIERNKADIDKIVAFAQVLETLTREEDPDRYTMIPNHGNLNLYYQSGLLDIAMIVGWNVYFGWYSDNFDYLTDFLSEYHELMPDKPVMITEYGAGSDPRIYAYPTLDSTSLNWNSSEFDFSIDYQNAFHQSYIKQFQNIDFLSGTAVWNLFDFGSYSRNDAVPHINSKGLVTHERKPKDAFFIYQSWLSSEKKINFLSTLVNRKRITELSDRISISTNLPEVELFVNGESMGVKQPVDKLVSWNMEPVPGLNYMLASGTEENKGVVAQRTMNFELVESPYADLNINFGACTAFADEAETYWLPARVIDIDLSTGEPFYRHEAKAPCHQLGTLRNIMQTKADPLFQTGRLGIEEFSLKVEPGFYRIDLLFAKIDRPEENDVFDLLANGQLLKTINLHEPFVAHTITTEFYLEGQLQLGFRQVSGKTIINALHLTKID